MSDLVAKLQQTIAAQQVTIQTLLEQSWKSSDEPTAYGLLDRNGQLQEALDKKTSELSSKTNELEGALKELAQHQAELLQAQKLESVGRLAAGVAHEINTPIQFVSDSLHFLADGFTEFFQLYEMHREAIHNATTETDFGSAAQHLEQAEEALDYAYLAEQVPLAISRCIDGLTRVGNIVRSMKEFAHPDNLSYSISDINHMIETTTTMAAHEFKYYASLELDLQPVPQIECLQGELNQVILNLLVNASHAVADIVGDTGERGTISISTRSFEDNVEIVIRDSGMGIPENIQHQIFEPFFTTKPVGQGTGQGLAMARNVIVQKHGGTLAFDSEVGKGTTFTITLPVTQKRGGVAA